MGILRLNVRCFFLFVCFQKDDRTSALGCLFLSMSPVKTSWSCRPRTCPVLSGWCITKQANVFFFFLPKQKHLFFLFFVFVLVPASQRGEAYSTPRNWCLIKSSFLMWDVVTWFYFFVSPSVKTRRKKTKHRRLRMDIWTHGTLTVNNLLVISIWKVWYDR